MSAFEDSFDVRQIERVPLCHIWFACERSLRLMSHRSKDVFVCHQALGDLNESR
jgi:hypothetical protein